MSMKSQSPSALSISTSCVVEELRALPQQHVGELQDDASAQRLRGACRRQVRQPPAVGDHTGRRTEMSAQQRESREARFAGSAGEPSVAAAAEEAAAAAAAPSNVSKATGGGLLVN